MRIDTTFLLEENMLKRLQVKAKAENRSLNNYVETILAEEIDHEPNEETIQAIYEARNNINMTKITDLEAFRRSFLEDV